MMILDLGVKEKQVDNLMISKGLSCDCTTIYKFTKKRNIRL